MSPERITSFPTEPLRLVTQEAMIASRKINGEPAQEKDGQLYMWDNVMQFPDKWRTHNEFSIFVPERSYLTDKNQQQKENKDKQLSLNFNPTTRWPEEDLSDGRGYSFPDELRPKTTIFWPEEDPLVGEGYYYPHQRRIPTHYVRRNQSFWRNAKRGLISKPLELQHTGNFLHRKMLSTFNLVDSDTPFNPRAVRPMMWPEEDPSEGRGWSYPSKEKKPWSFRDSETEPLRVHKPILVGSVVFDNPANSTSEFVHAERYPTHIPEKDRKAWAIGMERITEYATNYATKRLFRTFMDFPIGRSVAEFYNQFSDLASYRLLISGTYSRMGEVERQAVLNGKDYEDALYKGLFAHDFTAINELIADTKEYSDCSNIDDMAMQIGYERFKKIDIGKILGKLELKPENGNTKKGLKNLAISCVAGGVYRNPGVTEVSAAGMALMILEPVVVNSLYLLTHPDLLELVKTTSLGENVLQSLAILAASGVATYGLVLPFVGAHENIHNYSANRKFMGYIHSEIINKENTPGFAMLEPEEQSPEQ